MKINIHTPSGLIPISPEVTKQTIIEALGYTPADQAAYDSIDATDDTTFYIIDSQQHILAKVDADGLHAAIMTVNGKDVESGLIYDIKELDDSAFYIVDKDQNVICRIDENGLTTTNISAIDAILSGYSVVEHIEDEVIHVTADDRERWDNKSDFESITEDDNSALNIVDKDGHVIAKFDGDGLHTTGIEANNAELIGDLTASDAVLSGESVVEHMNDYDKHLGDEITVSDPSALTIVDKNNKSIAVFDADGFTTTYVESYDVTVDGTSVLGHIEDNTRHITSSERSTWNTVTSKATKTELNTHIADTKKHFGDELRLDDDTTLYINDKTDKTIVKVSAEGLTAGEVILQSGNDLYSLLDHVTDSNIHLQEGERDSWNAKSDQVDLEKHIADTNKHFGDEVTLDDNTTFYINDSENRTIVRVDSEGLFAGNLFILDKQVATEEYVNDKITGLFEFKGSISSNEEVPAVHEVGDAYRIKVAGIYAGNVCEMGDMLVCIASGTTANSADWTVMQLNWSAIDGSADLKWNTSVTLASIGGIDINAKLPANPNTTYQAGTGLELDGTTFNHKNSVTAGTAAGGSGALDYKGTITIPSVTYDSEGHITSTSTTSYTLPANSNVTSKIATGSDGVTSNTTTEVSNPYINHVEGSTVNSKVQIKGANTATVKATNGVITIDSGVTSTEKSKWDKVTDKLDTSVYNADKAVLDKTISDINTEIDTKTNQTDFEQHVSDMDLHLGDEISLEDDATLYISDKDGAIIAKFAESGFDAKVIRQDDNVVASKVIVDELAELPYIAEDGTLHLTAGVVDTNTTYTFKGGTNQFTVTPSEGQATTITVTPSMTVSAAATDDDVVVLTGTPGTNGVSYDAKHAQKGPAAGYTSGNATTSVSGYGDSKTIKIPQITVDKYGHVTAAADEEVVITMPSELPLDNYKTKQTAVTDPTANGTAITFISSISLDTNGVIAATKAAIDISNKVDKVEGKGLSTNDYTTAEKNKLAGIASGAEVNVQSDWDVTDSSSDAFIKNKPTKVSDFTNDSGFITGVSWGEVTGKPTFATVATSGSYNDLSNKPTIPTVPDYLPNQYSLKFGDKSYNGSSEQTITAADLGLSQALRYHGVSETALTDGSTTNPITILGLSHTAESGCVVFYNNKEFVWNGSAWEELGDLSGVDFTGYATEQWVKDQQYLTKETLPETVTEATVAGWGFTKNTGTYSKPTGGIPKSDLSSDVQTSLGKADTALQSYTEKYTGTYSKPDGGIPKTDLDVNVQTSLSKADSALQEETYKGTVTEITAGTGLTGGTITGSGTIAVDTENYKLPTYAEWEAVTGVTGGVVGTVSSVGLTMPDAFTVTGSPITKQGTFNVTLNSDKYIPSVADKNNWNAAEANVQANWNETNESSDAFILNKPTLATVATSGSYNDLTNKPSIPTGFNITVNATDDNVVDLTASGGTNSITIDAKHAKQGPASGYTSGNETTSISSGTTKFKIPQLTVNAYGHVTAAEDEEISITIPTAINGDKGDSVTAAASGTSSDSDGYTITPITFTVGDDTLPAVNVKAKHGYTPVKGVDYFDGNDGKSISSVTHKSGTGKAGTTDVYSVKVDTTEVGTFNVYQGADGKDFKYEDFTPEQLAALKGPQGEQGPKGNDGTSVTIKGTKNDESQLPNEGNSNGDGYIVNGHLYVWDGNLWQDVGEIKGPQGEKGEGGKEIVSITSDASQTSGYTETTVTVTYNDNTSNTFKVNAKNGGLDNHTHPFTPEGTNSKTVAGGTVTGSFTGSEVTTGQSTSSVSVSKSDHTHSINASTSTTSVASKSHTHSANAADAALSISVATSAHKHTVSVTGGVDSSFSGTPATIAKTTTAGESVASALHTHSVDITGSASSTFTGSEVASSNNGPSYSYEAGVLTINFGHTHNVTAAGSVDTTFTGSTVNSGTPSATTTVASNAHTHSYTPAGTVTSSLKNVSATVEASDANASVTKSDHTHTVAATTSYTDVASTGHIHTMDAATSSENVSKSTHTHKVTAEGSLTDLTFTGTEHTHTFTGTAGVTGNPS